MPFKKSSLALIPSCEGTTNGWQFATWKRAFTSTQPHWHPNLRLPTTRTVRNKVLVFVSHPVYGTLLQWPEVTKRVPTFILSRTLVLAWGSCQVFTGYLGSMVWCQCHYFFGTGWSGMQSSPSRNNAPKHYILEMKFCLAELAQFILPVPNLLPRPGIGLHPSPVFLYVT